MNGLETRTDKNGNQQNDRLNRQQWRHAQKCTVVKYRYWQGHGLRRSQIRVLNVFEVLIDAGPKGLCSVRAQIDHFLSVN